MSTIRLHQTTTSTPEQYVAGLTDLGPCRSNLFGNSADEYLKVRSCDEPNRQGFVHRRGSHYRWTGRPEAASALLQDVVGKAKSPCRLVYGVASLPLGAPVELEVIFELAG